VFLSAAFATLNARLGMPPFALFLVALCLTDGAPASLEKSQTNRIPFRPSPCPTVMTMTFFFNVTDTGKSKTVPPTHNPFPFARAVLTQRLSSFFFFLLLSTWGVRSHAPPLSPHRFEGSWLQIGQSISHFCITSLLLVFSAGIASVGEALMRGSGSAPRHRLKKGGTRKREA
jgi:phosphatidylinositol glycan class N